VVSSELEFWHVDITYSFARGAVRALESLRKRVVREGQ
jgi:hypothetical protein